MNASAAVLSEQDISYARPLPEPTSYGPAALEDWQAELWRRAEQRLRESSLLEDDWDGAGAEAPSEEALDATREYLQVFYREGVIPPTALSPTPLGSIMLEWRLNDSYFEAEISGLSMISWMLKLPDGSIKMW